MQTTIVDEAGGPTEELDGEEVNKEIIDKELVKDSKWKAILFSNLACIGGASTGVFFKKAAISGVSVIEFWFFSNLFVTIASSLQLLYKKMNPFKGITKTILKDIIIRTVSGQSAFILLFQSVTLLPISTSNILFNLYPFWINILACVLLRERLRIVDILGIVICFGGVIMIAVSKNKQAEEAAQ